MPGLTPSLSSSSADNEHTVRYSYNGNDYRSNGLTLPYHGAQPLATDLNNSLGLPQSTLLGQGGTARHTTFAAGAGGYHSRTAGIEIRVPRLPCQTGW